MEKPLISIIVPIYNSEAYLNECLESIKNQTYCNLEIIMIDDGSTDNSRNVCMDYVNCDNRFRYIYQQNMGVSNARNNALSVANGEYIGFVDSDDFIEKDMFETLYNILSCNKADVSIISFIDYYESKENIFKDSDEVIELSSKEAIMQMHRGYYYGGHLWTKLIKKEKLLDFKLDEKIAIYEDILFLSNVFTKCDKIVYKNVHKYYYRFNEVSALNNTFKKSYLSGRLACKKMLEDIHKIYPEIISYPQKTLLEGDILIVIKILQSGKEKEYAEYFKEIKKEIKKNLNSNSFKLVSSTTMKIYIISFVVGRSVLKMIRGVNSGIKKFYYDKG